MTRLPLPKLYAIIDRETLDARGLRVGEFARELRAAGVRLVQYRDKVSGPREVLRVCAEIEAVFAGVEALLVLNDRADLAALVGWGVHVGQGDLLPADARAVALGAIPHPSHEREGWDPRVGGGAIVGVSTHNEEQVLRYAQEGNACAADYVAIGPVFGTRTKLDAEPVVGLEGVRRARALTRRPLVAIGGITRENARSVMEAGVDSVAVIGGLFVPGESVEKVARDFLEILG